MTFVFKHPSKYKNPTLTKNMPNVKWDQIPPVQGPEPLINQTKPTIQDKLENINGRNRQSINRNKKKG
jgi:hypothetical protein